MFNSVFWTLLTHSCSQRWESKVVQSRVADFEQPQPPAAAVHSYPATLHAPSQTGAPHQSSYTSNSFMPQTSQPHVKSEPVDGHFPAQPYLPPPLPGPQINGAARAGASTMPPAPASYATLPPLARPSYPTHSQSSAPVTNGQGTPRMPQVDGPSSSSSVSPSPPPSQSYAPRASHPSLPPPAASKDAKAVADSEEINSDLDDSDSENEEEEQEGSVGDTDIVFCTYDKVWMQSYSLRGFVTDHLLMQVARVKNKWKCVLKDGMIHVNGKDYLFAKCTW